MSPFLPNKSLPCETLHICSHLRNTQMKSLMLLSVGSVADICDSVAVTVSHSSLLLSTLRFPSTFLSPVNGLWETRNMKNDNLL